MRIIVISDTHGDYRALEKIIERNLGADRFIHLGDGERELNEIVVRYPQLDILHVAGNCDFASLSPTVLVFGAGEYKILAVHGHNQGVKGSLASLTSLALRNGADIVLFGHTHARAQSYEDGMHFLNPGSAAVPRDGKRPSYGFIDITKAGIVTQIVEL